MVILDAEIPLTPPSVNTYWRSNGKRRFITPKGIKFKKDMGYFVPYVMSDKRLRLEVELCYPDKRTRDLDNSLKSLCDSLVGNGLCVDDEQFDELIIKRGEIIKGGLIKIKVTELI